MSFKHFRLGAFVHLAGVALCLTMAACGGGGVVEEVAMDPTEPSSGDPPSPAEPPPAVP